MSFASAPDPWHGDVPYAVYQDPQDVPLDPNRAAVALADDRIFGIPKEEFRSVLVEEKLFLVETSGDAREAEDMLRLMAETVKFPPGNAKFRLVGGKPAAHGVRVALQDGLRVIPVTLVAPTFRVGSVKDDGCMRFYELPDGYVGGDLLAALPDAPGGLAFAAVNGQEAATSIQGNPKRFALGHDGRLCSNVPDWHAVPIEPWPRGDPALAAAQANGGPGAVIVPVDCFAALAIEATFATPGWRASPFNDGSLVEAREGKLWCSSTADPATHQWVPVITLDAAA